MKLQCLPRPRPSVTWAKCTWLRADMLLSWELWVKWTRVWAVQQGRGGVSGCTRWQLHSRGTRTGARTLALPRLAQSGFE